MSEPIVESGRGRTQGSSANSDSSIFAPAGPSVFRPRHDHDAVVKQGFRMNVLVDRWRHTPEKEVELAFAQVAVLLRGRHIGVT